MLDMTNDHVQVLGDGACRYSDVIRTSTIERARPSAIPSTALSVGTAADVAVLNLLRDPFGFHDSLAAPSRETAPVCELTLKDGRGGVGLE